MATIDLQQTDNNGSFGADVMCSGATIGETTPQCKSAPKSGSAGSVEVNFGINKAGTEAGIMFQSDGIGETSWDAGTYTVRVNVTTAQANLEFAEVYVCRANSSGINQATVGSLTGLTEALSAGTHTFNVTGSSQTAGATDVVYIVLVIFNTQPHADQTGYFTPSLVINTPITSTAAAAGLLDFERATGRGASRGIMRGVG